MNTENNTNNKKYSVSVLIPFEEDARRRLTAISPESDFTFSADAAALCRADIVLGQMPTELIPLNPGLKWIQLSWAGTDAYTRPGVLPDGVLLTNVTGAFGLAISEHMLAAVLTLMKKMHIYRDDMKTASWTDRGEVGSIYGSTVLTVGLGDIGGCFSERVKALGAHTIGVRRSDLRKPDSVDELYLSDRLDELLPRADIVALAMPNTPQTRGMFDARRLSLMKKGAILVNVGRGNAVDGYALADALNGGRLGGASLDVTDPEPLPPEHPLWKCENALITPHVSGFYHLRATYDNIIGIFTENFRRFVAGEPLMNVIDMNTGYVRR